MAIFWYALITLDYYKKKHYIKIMEEQNKNLTVFQRLSQAFGMGTPKTPEQDNRYQYQYTSPIQNREIILKTTDKAEFEKTKLELQQQKYLVGQWAKTDSELYRQSIYYETTRLASYYDFESMEYTPEISAALDIFAEESTTSSDKGKILSVYSDSKRIKKILENLFYNVLDVNTNLAPWIRNFCKYGDNFIYLKMDRERGIVGCTQLPNIEIERKEYHLETIYQNIVNDKKAGIQFNWKNKDLSFQSWEIAHFRLLGDDRRLPYGTSILEKARRIWKQLLLAEDAMLVYRTTRAPERRVFKVFVGNMDDDDVEAYIQKVANKFKRSMVVDPKTGQVDTRFNQLPIWKDSPIPLLDGRTITIKELSDELKVGKENYVYSVQDNTHQIVPGKVTWCDKNHTAEKMIKVWLDDETYLVTAPEHPFVMRNGSKKRADELIVGESLMPFYRELKQMSSTQKNTYETIYNPNSGKYEFTHRLVAKEIEKDPTKKLNTIHHLNFDRYDNSPNNLQWVDYYKHIQFHGELTKKNWEKGLYKNNKANLIKYNKSNKKRQRNIELAKEQNWHERFISYNHSELHKEHDIIRKNAQIEDWSNPEKKELRSKSMQVKFDSFIWDSIRENIISKQIINRKTLLEHINNNLIQYLISINKNDRLNRLQRISRGVLEGRINENGFKTITEFITKQKINHKVQRIEEIAGDDVYCMTVVGLNGEDDRHNFATLSFKISGEISVSGSFLGNSVDQDFFIPVRDPNTANPIETLPGAQNLGEISDVEYIQKKLFAAIRTPKAFLGFEDVVGDGKNLALKDIRFARTINRIQQAAIQELNKIAIIHLYVLGFEEEIDNFTLALNNPSIQGDLMRIEALKEKAQLYKDLVSEAGNGFSITSMTWAKKNVFNFSEDEIRLDLEQQRLEKAASAEMEKTAEVIVHTGIFDNIDKIFGKRADQEPGKPAEGGAAGAPIGGGGGGLGGLGGGLGAEMGGGELGGEAGGLGSEAGGTTAGGEEFPPPGEEGDEEATPPEETNVEEEGFMRKGDNRPLLIENRISFDINEMLNSLDGLIAEKIDVEE